MKSNRVSRLVQHSQNLKTDKLYQPLRQTLIKSTISEEKGFRSPRIKELKSSKLSQQFRELTPEQAKQMQNNIYIPANGKLIPTDELWKVKGKKYNALDVQVIEHTPITQHQLKSKLINPQNIEETVYTVGSVSSSAFETPQLFSNANDDPYQLKKQNNQASPIKLKYKGLFVESSQSSKKSRIRTLKPPPKPKYKYNLFSSLDEPLNTKCQSCSGNEVVASRPTHHPWA